jgi:L-lysine exporter family protein LysE/ArgO
MRHDAQHLLQCFASLRLKFMFSASFPLPTFSAGFFLSISLIMAIGPQNAHLLRMGLKRQHLWLTAGVCALADMVLIAAGVYGLTAMTAAAPWLRSALLTAGVVFLWVNGSLAAKRAWHGFLMRRQITSSAQPVEPAVSRAHAIVTALGFSVLNPHAWLDTTVLIGSASTAYEGEAQTAFGLGAIVGSGVWFLVFGALIWWLGAHLTLDRIRHWIDAFVALMMWGIATMLMASGIG